VHGTIALKSRSSDLFEEWLDHRPLYDNWPLEGRQLHFAVLSGFPDLYNRCDTVSGLIVEPVEGKHDGYIVLAIWRYNMRKCYKLLNYLRKSAIANSKLYRLS
jgi:hypothetical protein